MKAIEEFTEKLRKLQDIPENFNEDALHLRRKEQDALYQEYKRREESLLGELITIANAYQVTPKDITSGTWTKADQISETQYHTQGFGSRKYAVAEAKRIAHRYESWGIPTKIEEVKEHDISYFNVFVECSYDLMIMLKYKRYDIKEEIKYLESIGVNPRVFHPFEN